MGLRTRLLLLVLVPTIPALILALYTNLEQRQLGRARVEKDAIAVVQIAAVKQLGLVDNTRQHLTALSRFPQALGDNIPAFDSFFVQMRKIYSDYADFGLLETNGILISCAHGRHATNMADRSFFKRVLATREFSIGSYQKGEGGTPDSLEFGFPVFNSQQQLARVIYAALDLSVLHRAAAQVRPPDHGVITVLDQEGHILARSPDPEHWNGKPLPLPSLLGRMRSHKQGTAEMSLPGDVRRLCAFTSVGADPESHLFTTVSIPLSLAYSEPHRILVLNLTVLCVVALVALALASIYAQRYVLRPVKALSQSTRQLTAGDLSARTGLSPGKGELNELAQAFDQMAESLQRQRAQNERLHAELEDRVKQRTAELEQSNRELEAFSYSVSHDLRAPLRHIHGYVLRLEEQAGAVLQDEHRRLVHLISKASKTMGILIDDLLAFSRMARVDPTKTRVNTAEVVQEVLLDLKRDTEGRNIQFNIPPLPEVLGDRAMLKQVWTNLLSNAVKYTRPRSEARVQVRAREEESEIEFSVADNGTGFDMRYVDKLFRVFERLHRSEEFEGTGIGLAIVRRIVKRHGGRTWAEGKLDSGATFYFTLPKAPAGAGPIG